MQRLISRSKFFKGKNKVVTFISHLTVNKINIHYETSGHKGKVVLCLPGSLGCSETDFSPQLRSLGGPKLQVICWDPPGYGKSYPPPRNFTLDFFEEDAKLAASLMKQLGHSKYSLLGWSDGGITSLFLSSLYPEQIEKMVVWGANAFLHEGDISNYEKLRNIEKWSEKMRAPMEAIYGKEYFKATWERWVDTMTQIHRERGGNICKEKLHLISCPTLIIHGKEDKMVDEGHAKYLHDHIEGSKLIIWENAKHNLHLRYADKFNELVRDFVLH